MILSGGAVSGFMKLWYSHGQQIIFTSSHNSFKKETNKNIEGLLISYKNLSHSFGLHSSCLFWWFVPLKTF